LSGQISSTKPVKVDIKKFVSASQRKIIRVSTKLDDYLTNADEKRIHDLRTAIRRLNVSCKTLPRKIREKRQIKNYIAKSKEVFKVNSQIRDLDVIINLIREKNEQSKKDWRTELLKVENRRKLKLKKAKIAAKELRKLLAPKIYKYKISSRKLTKRYNKLLHEYSNKIQLNLPLVLIDGNKVSRLHELRKDCKELRYLLELLPQGNLLDKNLPELEEELQNMQSLLGAIHDCDAAVAFLRRQTKLQDRNDIIESIIRKREKRYDDFLVHCKSDTKGSHARSSLFNLPNVLFSSDRDKL
jgi:CHAD domain-containing protein